MQADFRHIYWGICTHQKLQHQNPWQINPRQAHEANRSCSGSAILFERPKTMMWDGTRSGLHGERRIDHDPPFCRPCSVAWSAVTPTVGRTSFFRQTAHLHLSSTLCCSSTSHLSRKLGPSNTLPGWINGSVPLQQSSLPRAQHTKFPTGTNASTQAVNACLCTLVSTKIHRPEIF